MSIDVAAVGIIANPLAGTDVRRLSSPAGHTSNAAKVAIVRRIASAALEGGARTVLIAADAAGLGDRATTLIGPGAVLLDDPPTGTRHDTVAAARRMWKQGCAVVVVVGGDGTCRDVAIGWPGAPLIAMSTGTNNVFPQSLDPVAAGTAAGLLAAGRVPIDAVCAPAKRIVVYVGDDEHIALVDVAVLDGNRVGSRAVVDAGRIRAVVAAISTPVASGLSSIAGRVEPLGPDDPDGVVVHLGGVGRRVRIPLVPGSFGTVVVNKVERLVRGAVVRFSGPAVLAFDGERDVVVGAGTTIDVTVDGGGPLRVDVERVLRLAVERGAFDVGEGSRGD
jgi:ATP-NAD kinase N-terminal domain